MSENLNYTASEARQEAWKMLLETLELIEERVNTSESSANYYANAFTQSEGKDTAMLEDYKRHRFLIKELKDICLKMKNKGSINLQTYFKQKEK